MEGGGASAQSVCVPIAERINGRISVPLDHSDPKLASKCLLVEQQGRTLDLLCDCCERETREVPHSSTHPGLWDCCKSKASFDDIEPLCLRIK